jgi:hypothetical protein
MHDKELNRHVVATADLLNWSLAAYIVREIIDFQTGSPADYSYLGNVSNLGFA